jgi:O-antigen ligase
VVTIEAPLRRVYVLGLLALLAGVNAGLGLMLATARPKAVSLAVVPAIVVAIGSLIASSRAVLVFAAMALNLLSPLPVTGALPLHLGMQIYVPDVLVLLAVAAWVAAWLTSPKSERPTPLRAGLLGWPLLLFGVLLLAAIVRGHVRYGESIVGLPLRLLLYAAIAVAVTDLSARDAYRWLVALFYAGTVWQAVVAVYGFATGTSVTDAAVVSTGGERVLAGSTAMFMAGALLLALLNVEAARSAGKTAFHLLMVVLATFALVSTLQRTTFAALGVLVPLLLLAFRHIGPRGGALLPLCAPFLVLVALLVPKADPTFFTTIEQRISASPSTDTSAQWRLHRYDAVWSQIRDAPVTGVGFGRTTEIVESARRTSFGQDPHNQFLYLWAGGGLLLVGSFVVLLMIYLLGAWIRFRRASEEERRLIFWAASLWFVFLVNSLTGIVLTDPDLLLTFWILMVIPFIVRPYPRAAVMRTPAVARLRTG